MSNNNGNSTIFGFPGNLDPDLTPDEERFLICFEFRGTRVRDHIFRIQWDEISMCKRQNNNYEPRMVQAQIMAQFN